MNVFLRVDINIVAFVMLGIVFFIAKDRLDKTEEFNKKFFDISRIILLELFFETVTCIINRRPELWLIPISIIMHVGLYIGAPVLTYFWFMFIYSWINPELTVSKKKKILLLIPVSLNFILTIFTPAFHFVFYIDQSNVYHRGALFFISALSTYFYLVYSLILIILKRKKLIRQEFVPRFVFGILPILGGLCQVLFYGVLLMWSCTAFSLIILYIFLQQRTVQQDALTGVWTRSSFNSYMTQRIKYSNDTNFGAIYLDLDGLKQINDKYGHLEGDIAIKTSINLIEKMLRKTDVIARLGGDEFIIIADCDSKKDLDAIVEKISYSLADYNKTSQKQYKLNCSFGADIFNSEYANAEQFLSHIDTLMYKNKKMKKTDDNNL